MPEDRVVVLSLITGSFALENGNFLIEGRDEDGAPIEVELPGEGARGLIASLVSLMPKLRSRTPQGLVPLFEVTGLRLESSQMAGYIQLVMRIAPAGEFRFALKEEILEAVPPAFAQLRAQMGPQRKPS